MATLIPTSQPTGVEAYEDMFKEITRKLYGDESAHGLYPHNTQVAQVAQLASGAPAAPEGGERSFTTLVSDRNIAQIDYETTTVNVQQQQQQQQQQGGGVQQQGGNFKTEEHLTTAFGLAALMQNGFPPPGAILNPVHFPVGTALKPSTNIAIATTDDRWQQQTQQHTQPPQDQQQQSAGQEPSWASGGKQASTSTSYTPQKPFKKPKIEPQDGSPTGTVGTISTLNIPQTGNDKNKSNFGSTAVGAATGKRYSCTSCPYTTDRRDLFTRHENIHKEEKPFHCYACLKQFNRADHVKKHFLRMHRDMEYEIAKTRKSVSTKNNYYSPNAANSSVNNVAGTAPVSQSLVTQPTTIIQASNTLNIPTATFPTQITIPTHHNNQSTATTAIEHTITHDIATINGVVHHIQHQQQQQQQQQQHQQAPPPHQPTQIVLGPPIVTIKQEKGSTITTTTATTAAVATPTTMINNTQPHDIAGTGDDMANCDDKSLIKKVKGEKRFTCCYCPWSGADNWGLKRHLNTHTKPFVCMLCDYKAARSERLATHVFKVHNKKACNKCNYFAEDQDQLNTHMLESHLLNMQAIGRNKASVTQDFHNAGGGNQQHSSNKHSSSTKGTNKLSLLVAASSSASCSPTGSPSPPSSSRSTPPAMGPATTAPSDCYTASQKQLHHSGGGGGGKLPIANGMAMANLTEEHLSLLQLLATAAVAQQHLQQQQQQQQQLQLQQKATSTSISTSPPAHHPHQQLQNHHHHQHSTNNVTSDPANNNGSKQRRRKSSSRNDKENLVKRHPTATAAVISGGKVIDLTTSISNGTLTGPAEHGIERNNNHNGSSNNNNSSVNNKNINEAIFDRVYKKPYNLILTNAFCKPAPIVADKENAPTKDENFSLSEFLRNHKEVSISTLADVRHASQPHKLADDDEVVFIKEEKRLGRKQQKPQRNQAPDSELNASPPPPTTPSGGTPDGQQIGDVIRDKHMIRLITRKLCCRICQNQQRLEHMDNCHYHSKTSLILHNRWRHDTWSKTERCHLCRASFNRKYKLILHQRLKHTNRKSSSLSAVKTKSKTKKAPEKKSVANKKQRKRKSNKSRSGAKSSIGKRLK
ncbi:protein charlatan isoform X2 [Armigeres subalbatus]|uniref:protein charlatan isoform X2 n=1 Tax=Armigeres subalbatus TaxID=124917 RepID=UPI002ED3A18A